MEINHVLDIHKDNIRFDQESIDRFWGLVDEGNPEDCWPWKGTTMKTAWPYGIFHRGGSWRAHRIAYVLTIGPIKKGLVIMHSCDNPPCCNPAHLEMGTQSKNITDSYRRRPDHARFGY